MSSKSIFRQPGARHFQLVHRSQRDPLINDPEASAHVLKPVERENTKKGKSRADLESILTLDEVSAHGPIGQASFYGIYYDDTEYDYMQHLRTVGAQEESIFIEAPVTSKRQTTDLSSRKVLDDLELPDGVLASASEVPRNFEAQQAIPDSIAGFQPDMDPHLRQVLEALEDDAFVDENLDDDFLSQLVADGERDSEEDIDFEFTAEDVTETGDGMIGVGEDGWEKRFADFKKRREKELGGDSDDSEDGTVPELPIITVIGGKRGRRKGSSEASGYSMSSSSMYRNEALQTLDERFDQIILNEYQADQDKCKDGEDSDDAPELVTSRSDFDSMVNDFLNNYEIFGRKMKLKLEGETGPEKLDILRRTLGQDEHVRIADAEIAGEEDEPFLPDQDDGKARWDCETILTTYTNLGNHPRLIRVRDSKPGPRFQLDQKTGLPLVVSISRSKDQGQSVHTLAESDESEERGLADALSRTSPVARPRNESNEDKKKRKTAVKQEKQTRRAEKKTMKQQFGVELKEQKKRLGSRQQGVKKL